MIAVHARRRTVSRLMIPPSVAFPSFSQITRTSSVSFLIVETAFRPVVAIIQRPFACPVRPGLECDGRVAEPAAFHGDGGASVGRQSLVPPWLERVPASGTRLRITSQAVVLAGEQCSGFDGLMPPMPIDGPSVPCGRQPKVGQVGRPFQNVQWSSSFSYSSMIRWTSSPVQKP